MEKPILSELEQSKLDIAKLYLQKADDITITAQSKEDWKKLSFKMKDAFKVLDEIRLEKTKPLRDEVKLMNDQFASVLGNLDNKSKLIINAVMAFEREQQRQAAEQQRIALQQKQNELMNQIANKEKAEQKQEIQVIEIPKIPETTVSTRTVWGFDVVDLDAVPREYLRLDEQLVAQAIKAGTTKIKGLHIHSKEVAIRR